jgi:Bromodomain
VAPILLDSFASPLDRWRGGIWGLTEGMNSFGTDYTPLECLLLFQSLVAYGTKDQDLDRISDLLTNNSLIKDGPTYDAQRLSSSALRQLYLQLLRDELKAEEQDGHEEGGQTASKKRKLQSPPLPSFKDAQEYRDKLPLLVDRLYARYRDYMVRAIQEDERRYAEVQGEIGEIERGEWDERILNEDGVFANRNTATPTDIPGPETNGAPSEPLLQERPAAPLVEETPPDSVKEPVPAPTPAANLDVQAEPRSHSGAPTKQEVFPSSPKILEALRTGNESPAPNPPQSANKGPHAPFPLQPGPQQSRPLQWEPPYGPPNQIPQYPVDAQFPQFNSSQYQTQGYPAAPRGPFSNPLGIPAPHHHASPSQQIILVPPPNAMGRSPTNVAMPLDALADVAGQQFRAPSGPPMLQQQGPLPAGYQPSYPPQPQNHPPANDAPQWTQQYLPPYQGSPQPYPYPPTQRPPFPPRPDLIQPENRQYTSPYNGSLGPRPQITGQNQTPKPRPSLPFTPVSQGGLVPLTGSGTRWTPKVAGTTPRSTISLSPPAMEPLSPILRSNDGPRTSRKSGKKQIQKADQSKPSKTPKRGSQRTRAGSTTSSVIAGSYRSQSVMSHADEDELSLDNDVASRHVKEEVATPLGVDDAGDTTADESSTHPRLPSRSGPSPRHPTKRKRASSIPFEARLTGPLGHVMWTKAFPKISASALESISGHRNASTFAAPVKERDAPGYANIILRPQDLKSIRGAITHGSRAAAAAAPDDMNPNASNIWLPIFEDLIPPKGIINYAQLEKELMRMFANAVMFNADPDRGFGQKWQGIGKGKGDIVGYEIDEDGVIKDTRAMFTDVEKVVGSLRNAERRSEEMRESSMARAVGDDDEVDELAGDGDSHAGNTGSIAKRRRKA